MPKRKGLTAADAVGTKRLNLFLAPLSSRGDAESTEAEKEAGKAGTSSERLPQPSLQADTGDAGSTGKETGMTDTSSQLPQTSLKADTDAFPELSSSDFGDYLKKCSTLPSQDKFRLLSRHWTPSEHFVFPFSESGKRRRHFNSDWLRSKPWLVYSPSTDGALCKFCMCFAAQGSGGLLVTKPFRNWQKAGEKFQEHSKMQYHQDATAKTESFLAAMRNPSKAINVQLNNEAEQQIQTNRQVLNSIGSTVLFCGRQGIALRGKRDDGILEEDNKSNFNALLQFRMEAGDEILAKHLQTCDRTATYISKTTQNRLIEIIGEQIRDKIIAKIKRSQYYSVLADEVIDSANVEQLCLVLRFVDPDTEEICEEFLAFVQCENIRGETLAQNIMQCLATWGLRVEDIRGQGYDGASNMAGKYRGVQARILESNQKALYFHCAAHCLNLCIVKACGIKEVMSMMYLLRELSLFFSLSPKRQQKLENVIEEEQERASESKRKKLVDLCKTRWVERHSALEAFADLFPMLTSCFQQMACENTWDSDTLVKAAGFLKAFQSGGFLVSFVVARKTLQFIKPLTLKLQQKAKDVVQAYTEIRHVKVTVHAIRGDVDAAFHSWFQEAQEMAAQLDYEIVKPRYASLQTCRSNHPAKTSEAFFQNSIAIPFLDHLSTELDNRFTTASEVAVDGLSVVPSLVQQEEHAGFHKLPEGVQRLSSLWEDDLPSQPELESEYIRWANKWKRHDGEVPDSLSKALRACNAEFYPNIHKLLTLLCVLPITTCECERSISRLRTLKNYLRTTMGKDRLNGLALMRIHRSITVDMQTVVDTFATRYQTLMPLKTETLLGQ